MMEGPTRAFLIAAALAVALAAYRRSGTPDRARALAAFSTVQQVLQHPRCQNCHIPGDAPLQFDAGLPHTMAVARGPAVSYTHLTLPTICSV